MPVVRVDSTWPQHMTVDDSEWTGFLRRRFSETDPLLSNRILDHALQIIEESGNTLRYSWSEIVEYRDKIALEVYENDLHTHFYSLPSYVLDVYLRYARRISDTAHGKGIPQGVLRIALMAWMDVEDEKITLGTLEVLTKEHDVKGEPYPDDVSDVETLPSWSPSSSEGEDDIGSCHSDDEISYLTDVSELPVFYQNLETRGKRKHDTCLTNEMTGASVTVPIEIGEIVHEVKRQRIMISQSREEQQKIHRELCVRLTDEAFERSPWVAGTFLEDWEPVVPAS